MSRTRLVLALLALVALMATLAACGSDDDSGVVDPGDLRGRLRQGRPRDRQRRRVDRRHRQAGFPAVHRSTTTRPTARASRAPSPTRSPTSSASTQADVKWTVVPFNSSYAPGEKKFDFDINQISINAEAPASRRLLAAVLHDAAGRRHAEVACGERDQPGRPQGRAARRPDGHHQPRRREEVIHPPSSRGSSTPPTTSCRAQERPGRRHRGRPADRLLPRRASRSTTARSWASSRRPAATTGALLLQKDSPLTTCLDQALMSMVNSGELSRSPTSGSARRGASAGVAPRKRHLPGGRFETPRSGAGSTWRRLAASRPPWS